MHRVRREAFRVEAGEEGDTAALARLAARCFAGPWSEAAFRGALQDREHTRILVARREGPLAAGTPQALAGYAVVRVVVGELEILDLAVDPSWRRMGLGRSLLAAALEHGAQRGAHVAYLEVRESNEAARALYSGLGFEMHSRRPRYYRNPGEGALVLRLDGPLGNRP